MDRRKTRAFPAALEAARHEFEQWRQSRQRRTRIPERLWAVAVEAAGQFGVNRTAKALRIDPGRLKQHVLAQPTPAAGASECVTGMATFVELPSARGPSRGACVIQLEDRTGSTMRIEVVQLDASDLVALARSFWEA